MSRPINLISSVSDSSNHSTEDSDSAWKKELAGATTSASVLLQRLDLSHHIETIDESTSFDCLVTDNYLSKMETGNINDPLLLQVLPLMAETDLAIQHSAISDPVGDLDALKSQGLIQKYHGRALLISTGACAIHCRYCFRRDYPYQQSSCTANALNETLAYLKVHTEIDEIILSGGDPLILDNEKLHRLITQLESIEHLQTLRIHSRLPVVLPNRINCGLLELLSASRFQLVLVIHANHANELQQAESTKLKLLHEAGVTLLNQSVLLKGVNDNAGALIALSKRLFQCKTLPYYLHQLDPVKAAMHFAVGKHAALELRQQMEEQLPGYLVPRLVQEIAGNKAKTAIFRF